MALVKRAVLAAALAAVLTMTLTAGSCMPDKEPTEDPRTGRLLSGGAARTRGLRGPAKPAVGGPGAEGHLAPRG